MYCFEEAANRSDTGNMKGAVADRLPGETVCLWGAEMDYPTAPCIRRALADFAEKGIYGYTLPTAAYTAAIRRWMKTVRNAEIEEDWIVPVMGTVYALCTAVRAFTDEGDGVIIQSPSYYRFDRAVERNGRRIVSDPLREVHGQYTLDLDDLEEKMSDPRNRLLILVNPHNPTGRVFSESELLAIRDLAARHGVIVFSDEIFAETAQPGHETRPYATLDSGGISCFSLGKSFNFTGVNQANLLIPDRGLRERYLAQRDRDHFGSIDPFFYQALLAAYSDEGAVWLREMNRHTAEIYEMIRTRLEQEMPLLSISPLEGGYIAWIDCRGLGLSDGELRHFFEQEALICADPGCEYGETARGFYRWNIATPKANMEKALSQLKAAYDKKFHKEEQ